VLLGGSAGVGGVYDVWRRLKAAIQGRKFHADHQADFPNDPARSPTQRPESLRSTSESSTLS
jgi:hypothetical protein